MNFFLQNFSFQENSNLCTVSVLFRIILHTLGLHKFIFSQHVSYRFNKQSASWKSEWNLRLFLFFNLSIHDFIGKTPYVPLYGE